MVVGRDGIFKALSISCLVQCLLVVRHIKKADGCISRGKDTASHRDAMKAASETWAVAKAKIERSKKSKARKIAKEKAKAKN